MPEPVGALMTNGRRRNGGTPCGAGRGDGGWTRFHRQHRRGTAGELGKGLRLLRVAAALQVAAAAALKLAPQMLLCDRMAANRAAHGLRLVVRACRSTALRRFALLH